MTNSKDGFEKAAGPAPDPALRKRAEEKLRVMDVSHREAAGPEETRQLLHELRVHQIELEMQNEELRNKQVELDASRERYFDLYDLAPTGYVTVSEKGMILEANLAAATMLGVPRGSLVRQPLSRFILKEDQDIYYRHRKILFETGAPQVNELRMAGEGGAPFWARLEAAEAMNGEGDPVCRLIMSDITEQKFRANERDLTARLVLMITEPGDFRERMADLTASLQGWSGCEAVGIRLQDGDDYPYFETRGFPAAFVQAESRLCARGPDGDISRDARGNPVLECMCGNVLRGRFDPAKPFFTDRGSFWTNNSTALLASTAEADRQARTRNRCNGEGYESVALIPLRTGGQAFGLLQFNDRRPDRFTPDLIACFEGMADSLAIALGRRQAEEKLKEYSERLEEMVAERTRELKTAQEELILKERMAVLGHFAGNVSHELRNPLGAIDSSAYFLNMKLGDADEKTKEHIGRIRSNVTRSTAIIQSLLDLSRMVKPKTKRIALAALVSNAISSADIPDAVETTIDPPDDSLLVDVDPEQIRMALKNILNNAVQAMDGAGRLTISARRSEAGEIELSVADTGSGISCEHLDKVFEPLFSTKTCGIGFGLSITKMIVENHGGAIRAESSPETGAAIVLTLPCSGKGS